MILRLRQFCLLCNHVAKPLDITYRQRFQNELSITKNKGLFFMAKQVDMHEKLTPCRHETFQINVLHRSTRQIYKSLYNNNPPSFPMLLIPLKRNGG